VRREKAALFQWVLEDVFSKVDMCRAHYEKVGLGGDFVNRFVR
jgi:hypothetical protein